MALVPSRGRVYAWGLGGAGQLGNRASQSATTPQVVLGPWSSPSGSSVMLDLHYSPQIDCVVKHIFSGGDHCFVTISNKKVCFSILLMLLLLSYFPNLYIYISSFLFEKEKKSTTEYLILHHFCNKI